MDFNFTFNLSYQEEGGVGEDWLWIECQYVSKSRTKKGVEQ